MNRKQVTPTTAGGMEDLVPGGNFILYESQDEHNESLGVRQFGITQSMKTKIDSLMETGKFTLKLLVNTLQSTFPDDSSRWIVVVLIND